MVGKPWSNWKEQLSRGKVEWPEFNCPCYLRCLETKHNISSVWLMTFPLSSSLQLVATSHWLAAMRNLAQYASDFSGILLTSSCFLKEEGAPWHQPEPLFGVQKIQQGGDGHKLCMQGFRWDIGELFPNDGILAKLCLAASQKDTLQRPHVSGYLGWDPTASPSSAMCFGGESTKLDNDLLPGLEGHLDSAKLLEDVLRSNERKRSLEGAARVTPVGCPTAAGLVEQAAGPARAGLTFGKMLVPRGCRVPPTEPPLPAAPGVFQHDTQAGAAGLVFPLPQPSFH